ncbi:flavodoxin family protein [Erysipelotrichaceae bacterium OttesenSCG-928-M19]|nr:flavodoxin family protein [Erysipelotrichaceae bacterium OttesenSCG-928-M19]
MKIVVLNGSPQKNGITKQITDYLLKNINAEITTHYAYEVNVKACIACHYCFKHPNECVIKDDFQQIMTDFAQADVVVLASPLHFSSFTGQLLSVISRMQYLFALKYEHKQEIPFKNKKGVTIITGGNDYKSMFDAIKPVDSIIYNHINAKKRQRLLIKATDQYSVPELIEQYQAEIIDIISFIKE